MRFREEVLAKIFTYITVVVLLGIVAFEAWGLSRERSRRKDAEDNAAVLQEEVENMRDINSTLKKENGELSAFRNKWNVYVSSLTSSEVLELQHDLFMRTDLIPQEAKEEIAEREAGLLAEETDGKSTSEQSSSKNKTSKTDSKNKTTDNSWYKAYLGQRIQGAEKAVYTLSFDMKALTDGAQVRFFIRDAKTDNLFIMREGFDLSDESTKNQSAAAYSRVIKKAGRWSKVSASFDFSKTVNAFASIKGVESKSHRSSRST